jgi:uncharacterized protein (TIGR01741 family)
MESNKMQQIYQEVAHLLVQMIPENWSKVFVYAEIREGFKTVFFYYYPQESTVPIYSLDITDKFHIDQTQFIENRRALYKSFTELFEEFKVQNQEPWTQVTYILDSTGELKINYNYEDISQISPVEKREQWEAKYLGIHG